MLRSNPTDLAPPAEVAKLTKLYKSIRAVDGISFTLAPGTITALLGGNGAGKTTTIAMLLGLVAPTSGRVAVFGTDMTQARAQVAGRMNFVSPYIDMPMRLTVRQNLDVYSRLYGIMNVAERIKFIAEDFQIADLLDRSTGKLSAGQKTRVSVAKALLNAPDLLLLDEPTASLDPDTADWIRARLQQYCDRRGATILLASHNMNEVERLADRVLMMEAGRIVEDAAPRQLIKSYGRASLEDVFLDISRRRTRKAKRKPAAQTAGGGAR